MKNVMNRDMVLVSGAIVYKKATNGRTYWLITKSTEGGKWEIPKTPVRKTESSVRASMRNMSEKAGMNIKVLEEAGRAGGSTVVNGKLLPKRYLYYLAKLRSGEEILGFYDIMWTTYSKARRKLALKREKEMFSNAKKELKEWRKKQKERKKKQK